MADRNHREAGRSFQLAMLAKLEAEETANDELRRTNPEAYRRKVESMLPENSCCLCRQRFRGYGNNPWPVLQDGKACEECNVSIVLTARVQAARNAMKDQ